jgi:nicotinate dehydrogenase subunit B
MNAPVFTRRRFTAGLGALVVTFSLDPNLALGQERLPGSLQNNRKLDGWIRINPDGSATVFTGKVELGQGILTALAQIAAEEIDLPLARVRMISGDTRQTPNEGQTAGSQSIENSGTALRMACAEARAILIDLAAKRLGVAADQLKVADGVVSAPDGRKIGYGELNPDLNREATAKVTPKPLASHKIVGKSIARFDIPAKVTGGLVYVQDMRPAGMLHGRVIRPPRYGSKLDSADEAAAKAMPGVIAVVRDGSFLGVVAEREEQAIKAREALRQSAKWTLGPELPDPARIFDVIKSLPSKDAIIGVKQGAPPADARTFEAVYTKPYMSHGSIGPSCSVAEFKDERMTVWTHSQGVFPLRAELVKVLKMPATAIRCVHVEGSGCYGHNGADDVAADATLLARLEATAGSRTGNTRCGATAIPHVRNPRTVPMCSRAGISPSRRRWDRRRARRNRPAAAIATPFRFTISRASGWSIISCRTCRSGSRRCARSAPMPTCSRSNPSWMSSRPRPAPIRSLSALHI